TRSRTSPASRPTGATAHDPAQQGAARGPDHAPAMDALNRSRLDRLLRPRAVAIVGVSTEPGHMGGSVLNNLTRCHFEGDIHLVSRSRGEIGGRRCLPSIDDLPHGVDV